MKRISFHSSDLCRFLFCVLPLMTACGKQNSTLQTTPSLAVLSMSPMPLYDYGLRDLGSTTDKTFTITNQGNVAATEIVSGFYMSLSFNYKDGSFPGTGGTCTNHLEAQNSCTVVVSYTAKFSGTAQATLTVTYNNGSSTITANGPSLSGQGN